MIQATIRTPEGYYHGEDVTREVAGSVTNHAMRNGFHNHIGICRKARLIHGW